jgi:hypothetical protein
MNEARRQDYRSSHRSQVPKTSAEHQPKTANRGEHVSSMDPDHFGCSRASSSLFREDGVN